MPEDTNRPVERGVNEADLVARRLGEDGASSTSHPDTHARRFGEPHRGRHPHHHARRIAGSPTEWKRNPHLKAQRRVGHSLSSAESTDASSDSDLSSDESFTASSVLPTDESRSGRGDELRDKPSILKEPHYVRKHLEDKDARPVDFLYTGLKKSFRGEKDGSVIAPHTVIQLAAIFAAELLGTAMLLFMGCFGLVFSPGAYSKENEHLIVCLIFGLTVMFIIQIIGHTSACHINPAVTLCALLLGKLRVVTFFVYFVAQIIGALLGVGVLKAVMPANAWNSTGPGLGCCRSCVTIPHPSLNGGQAFLIEFIITGILVFTVCSVWDKRNGIDSAAPIKFGLTIAGLALAAGSFTGASMNPARSFGPAVWEVNFEKHWVYWAGPMAGSLCATLTYTFVFERDYWLKVDSGDLPLTDVKSGRGRGDREAREVED